MNTLSSTAQIKTRAFLSTFEFPITTFYYNFITSIWGLAIKANSQRLSYEIDQALVKLPGPDQTRCLTITMIALSYEQLSCAGIAAPKYFITEKGRTVF